MPFVRPRALRRRLAVLLLALVTVIGGGVSIPVTHLAPGTASAVAAGRADYDKSVGASDCALLGRAYSRALGCARDACVPDAVLWRKVPGAEACALPGQPRGYGYAATVDAHRCGELHRHWIAAVNYCASEPDRSRAMVVGAPQCARGASVYVTLAEKPGHYDECVNRGQAAALVHRAAANGTTPAEELARDQRHADDGPAGVLAVGDSVTWRGGDELIDLWPELAVDGEPARRPTELATRIRAYEAHHGAPTGLVVELGSNPAPGYGRADLSRAVADVPADVPVLLVLPYAEVAGSPAALSTWSRRFDGWMRSVAAGRPHTCVADWPAYVERHAGLLQDGLHVRNDAEGEWAQWLVDQWAACTSSE